jgi:Domain of unknown function (DUF4129)
VVRFSFDDQLRLLERLGFKSPGAQQLGWAFGAGLVGWLLWVAWHVGSGGPRPRRDTLARAYANLCRKVNRAGVTRAPYHGPLAFADEISRLRPDLANTVHPLLLRYAQLRYGPVEAGSYGTEVRDFERKVRKLAIPARASETQPR